MKCQHSIVAVSGGVDSLVLLHQLAAQSSKKSNLQVILHPLYIDHGQRKDTLQDWKCVQTLSKKLGLKARRLKLALEPGASEADLREARYEKFKEFAETLGLENSCLFTAHHADDQLETFLLKISRGAHPQTIRGIFAKGVINGLRVCRPLLKTTKEEILDYARLHGISWHEDSTNQNTQFTRNRMRHEILPVLELIRPRSKEKFLRFFEDIQKMQSAAPKTLRGESKLRQGILVKKLDFLNLKAILDQCLGSYGHRTTRAHWENVQKILDSRHATKSGGGPRKLVQFPGGGHLIFEGPLVRWKRPLGS